MSRSTFDVMKGSYPRQSCHSPTPRDLPLVHSATAVTGGQWSLNFRIADSSVCFPKTPAPANVKGCRMPALSRRWRCAVGRRPTSLEGGNRGMPRGGGENELRGYGDLKGRVGVGCCKRADQAKGDVARMAGARVDSAHCSVIRRGRNDVIAP